MKLRKEVLDGDFIGGEGALTAEEEKALSAYFQQKKVAKLALDTKKSKAKVVEPMLFGKHRMAGRSR